MDNRDDLAEVLAVTSVHHPMFCDCDGFERCEGLTEQIDAVLAAGYVSQEWIEREVSSQWRAVYNDTAAKLAAEQARNATLTDTIERVEALVDERSGDVPYTGWLTVHRLRAALGSPDGQEEM